MFNLIVSGNGDWWERQTLSFGTDRFKEFSGYEADAISLTQPETLRLLEDIPTLLMYEVGAGGPNARVVRHGRIHHVTRRGRDITFTFEPDVAHAYLDRTRTLAFAEALGIERFEQHRTHWAIKDGQIPAELLQTGVAQRTQRTVNIVATEYVVARREGHFQDIQELEEELGHFTPSLEKALSLLPASIIQNQPTPEIYPIMQIEPRTPEGRTALEAVLARHHTDANLPFDWPYSLAWFLDRYGSPTEVRLLEEIVQRCASHMVTLGAEADMRCSVEDMAYAVWRSARSPLLMGRLRREMAVVIGRLVQQQDSSGFWNESREGVPVPGVRATALATVALQRVGDDRYHAAIGSAVCWLLTQILPNSGALPRYTGEDQPDVIATTLALEAIRRSDMVETLPHVLAAGDAWLVTGQTVLGEWHAPPFSETFVASIVLEYLARQNEMLPQVDGFLLMARDFYRKAVECQHEGGANNRRLAAIAAVHAIEMFLYGLFERREDLALSAFRDNGTETLGPREALRALQDALRRIGVLTAPQLLPYRDQLSSLISRRDGIIHRAHEISETELSDGLRSAQRFIERFGKLLLQLNLLQ